MSARKSWDIPRGSAPREAAKTPAKKQVRLPARPVGGTMPLRARRRRARMRILMAAILSICILAALMLYGLNQPQIRITRIDATGEHERDIPEIAAAALKGSHAGIVPRDSIFFYSEDAVRGAVLNRFPDISSLSVRRTGFSSILITTSPRLRAFSWCGAMAGDGFASCYDADGEGFVYGESREASTTLKIYAPLRDGRLDPVGATVEAVNRVPLALQFVRSIEDMGAPIESLQLRGDEADLFVRGSSTRITYVLGKETEAAGLAATVIPTLSLTDGTIEYLDLRFSGKAYVKRIGEDAPQGGE